MTSKQLFPKILLFMLTCTLVLLLASGGWVHAANDEASDSDTAASTEREQSSQKDSPSESDTQKSKEETPTEDGAKDSDTKNQETSSEEEKGDKADQPDSETENNKEGTSNTDTKAQMTSQIEDSMANIELIHSTLESLRTEIANSKESANLNRSHVETIKNGLDLIDNKLKEAYSGLDESRNSIATNTADIIKIKQEVLSLLRDVRANGTEMQTQKSLIEDNSIRMYELLIQMTAISDRLDNVINGINTANPVQGIKKAINIDLNRLWMLLSIVLVFFAPLAFVLSGNREQRKPLPDGTGQQQGMVLACLGVFLGYFVIGFGLMYGTTVSGWFGLASYLFEGTDVLAKLRPNFNFAEFFMYQTGFVMLAALIVYLAVGRYFSSTAHMILALFVGAILIPVFGHWAWSSYFIPGNKGLLEGIGFVDQAGATTISSIAAWFALVLVWKLGNRPNHLEDEIDAHNADEPVYSSSTTQLLWLSWLGFTTGTLPISSEQISNVMLNVGLAASAGGMAAFLHYVFFYTDKGRIARGLGGFVSGLVAIAACAQSVTFAEAVVIGASAGLLQNMAFNLLSKHFLTKPWQTQAVYLVAIHGVAGAWGTLCFALMGTEGSFATPNWIQLVIQLQGIAVALVYSIVLAHIALFLFSLDKRLLKVNT